jgi:integrase
MLLDDYRANQRKSLRRADSGIKHLKEFFGDHRAVEITGDRVQAYIRWRQEASPTPKPATIQYELAILKRMFTLAVKTGKVDRRPHVPSLRVRNARSGFFEEDEIRRVLEHLPTHVKPVVQFAYLTGWRIGEVMPLRWSQVDFRSRTVRLEPGTTKNDEGRVFPFGALPALASVLKRQRALTKLVEREQGRVVQWVFHRRGDPIKSFRGAWKTACQKAGLENRLVHDLRRTAVRNLERAGVPRSVAMKLTGHKTESVYRRYAIVSESDLSEGVQKLGAVIRFDVSEPRKILPYRTTRRAAG